MDKEIGRGKGDEPRLGRVLGRRLSSQWPAAMLQAPTLFRADGLSAKVLLTTCATAARARSSVPRTQQLIDVIDGRKPTPTASPVRLRASYAQFAELLVNEAAPIEAIRRVQRAVRTLERCELVATKAIAGAANELTVLAELSGQISTNLWGQGWIRLFNGPALWTYLYVHTHIQREGGRIGRKLAPRAGSHYMTRAGDLVSESGLSYPTVVSGLRVLRDLDLTREVRRGRDTFISIVDPDLWGRPPPSARQR